MFNDQLCLESTFTDPQIIILIVIYLWFRDYLSSKSTIFLSPEQLLQTGLYIIYTEGWSQR